MPTSYRISIEAEKDWANIVKYTLENFGENQVQKYTSSLLKCLDDLSNNKAPIKEMKISSYSVLIKPCKKHYIFALNEKRSTIINYCCTS